MMKAKLLKKKLSSLGVVVAIAVGASGAAAFFSGNFEEQAQAKKTAAETASNTLSSQLTAMQTQIAKSGEAEKRYAEMLTLRGNDNFATDSELMKNWLREAKDHYRFGDGFKLTLPLEQPSDKPELAGLNYTVSVREPVKIELDAMSDVHFFSFLDQMLKTTPGMIHISSLQLTRGGEMNAEAIRQMRGGLTPMLARAVLQFTWVGMEAKKNAANATPAAPGGM
jgi:hypothetical protein